MPHRAPKLLEDVRYAAERIEQFCAGRILADYQADVSFRSAVERQFEVIGEALSRLLKVDAAMAAELTEYRKAIDFRNALAHGYDLINNEQVWKIVKEGLPVLKKQVDELLARFGPP